MKYFRRPIGRKINNAVDYQEKYPEEKTGDDIDKGKESERRKTSKIVFADIKAWLLSMVGIVVVIILVSVLVYFVANAMR